MLLTCASAVRWAGSESTALQHVVAVELSESSEMIIGELLTWGMNDGRQGSVRPTRGDCCVGKCRKIWGMKMATSPNLVHYMYNVVHQLWVLNIHMYMYMHVHKATSISIRVGFSCANYTSQASVKLYCTCNTMYIYMYELTVITIKSSCMCSVL